MGEQIMGGTNSVPFPGGSVRSCNIGAVMDHTWVNFGHPCYGLERSEQEEIGCNIHSPIRSELGFSGIGWNTFADDAYTKVNWGNADAWGATVELEADLDKGKDAITHCRGHTSGWNYWKGMEDHGTAKEGRNIVESDPFPAPEYCARAVASLLSAVYPPGITPAYPSTDNDAPKGAFKPGNAAGNTISRGIGYWLSTGWDFKAQPLDGNCVSWRGAEVSDILQCQPDGTTAICWDYNYHFKSLFCSKFEKCDTPVCCKEVYEGIQKEWGLDGKTTP